MDRRTVDGTGAAGIAAAERLRAQNYPLARWYLRPLAGAFARWLTSTRVTPCHVTCVGLALAISAAAVMVLWPRQSGLAVALTLAWWFCDRTDGQLARLRGAASQFGAWLDANVDELCDIGLHAAVAYAATQAGSTWAWPCYIAFVAGKYLLMYGLFVEQGQPPAAPYSDADTLPRSAWPAWLRRLYHLPGNADVRVHLLVLALLSGQLVAELAVVALYYHLRWMVRYALVARRLGGAR